MQAYYGNFAIGDADSCEITSTSNALLNEARIPYLIEAAVSVTCRLTPDPGDTTVAQRQAKLTAKEMALRAALSIPFRDFQVRLDDGTPSSIRLLNAGSLAGVHVTDVNAPKGTGPEFASYRTVAFVVRASYPSIGAPATLISYTESLTFTGNGGPRTRMRETIDSAPVKQIVRPLTVCRANQSGQAMGFLGYPQLGGPLGASIPLFPNDLLHPEQSVTLVTPQRQGNSYLQYMTAWNYSYERTVPYGAVPRLWE